MGNAADANVNFGYTITTTAANLANVNAQVNTAKSNLGAFSAALTTALKASGISALVTAADSVQVTGVTNVMAGGTTTPSVVSAAVGSQAALSALALILGLLW